MSDRPLPECKKCHNPVVTTAHVARDDVIVNRPCGCEFEGDFKDALIFAKRDAANQRADELNAEIRYITQDRDVWRDTARELAKALESALSVTAYALPSEAQALARFEKIERKVAL